MPDQPTTESPISQLTQSPTLAVIGGTGKEGNALAARFARASVAVIIGSREAERGASAAQALNARLGIDTVRGGSNRDAAEWGEVILLAVPYAGIQPILEDIRDAVQGKIVINTASSLSPERKSRAKPPPAGSTTAEVQQFLGEGVRVVAALQNISPERLENPDEKIDSDVLVCGGDKAARATVIALIERMGLDAFDSGTLANAVAVETLTAALIAVNLRYKVQGAGIRLTGVPRGTP